MTWVTIATTGVQWIMWMNGAAGAGKSAIARSIVDLCVEQKIIIARFFFFRTDNSRNTIDTLVATLAYQIIQLLPETKKHIVEAIESNPLVFQQTFEAQVDLLVVRPLLLLRISDPAWTLFLIVDGVDECDGKDTQMSLIRTMAKLLRSKNVPVIVLFGSRRESQLLMAFDSREMTGILKQLPLDDNYRADEDILRFLNDSFDEIKQTHPFRKRLAADWPSPDHIQEIVEKSSGQFIYASVVIKFLLSPSANPSIRLDIIRGLRPTGRLTPFAQLDALYRHIFLQVDDLPTTLAFLAYYIFGRSDGLSIASYFFELEEPEVESMFVPLASVILCDVEANKIIFHHASLPDFLRNEARSGAYCINTLATPLSIRWFKTAESGRFRDLSFG